jgi:peptide methionine sulfoxide reductase msrA/msrB
MIKVVSYLLVVTGVFLFTASILDGDSMEYRRLTPEEENVIVNKGTEMPYTGAYVNTFEDGVYTCRRCGTPLFRSDSKFPANCGWPAFEMAIEGAVLSIPDDDGERTEILCAYCGGHLGHVFSGEGFTETDTRYCVNSISMIFIPAGRIETVYFAGGCFWGIEHTFDHTPGVLSAQSGYMGGTTPNPEYGEVCSGTTGHAETVKVVFDTSSVAFRDLAVTFFEIHDPSQVNRQGVDTGTQYRSAIFYTTEEQLPVIEELLQILGNNGYAVATEVLPAGDFWPAEEYHQEYFDKNGVSNFCHTRVNRFPED